MQALEALPTVLEGLAPTAADVLGSVKSWVVNRVSRNKNNQSSLSHQVEERLSFDHNPIALHAIYYLGAHKLNPSAYGNVFMECLYRVTRCLNRRPRRCNLFFKIVPASYSGYNLIADVELMGTLETPF